MLLVANLSRRGAASTGHRCETFFLGLLGCDLFGQGERGAHWPSTWQKRRPGPQDGFQGLAAFVVSLAAEKVFLRRLFAAGCGAGTAGSDPWWKSLQEPRQHSQALPPNPATASSPPLAGKHQGANLFGFACCCSAGCSYSRAGTATGSARNCAGPHASGGTVFFVERSGCLSSRRTPLFLRSFR